MNFFITVDGRKVKQGLFVILIAFFTAVLFFSQTSVHIPAISTKEEPKALYRGEKGIALTFNIGWGDIQAEPILDVLKEKSVRSATFFVSGAWAETHPDTIKRIKEMGFEIGSLGYAYEDYTELEDEKVRRDIARSIDVLKKLEVKDIQFLRSPTGHFDKRTLAIANQLGLTVVHWSLNSQDWKNPGVEAIIKQVNKSKAGDIVLLHASDSATQTAKALPSILSNIREKGELVTISILIANGRVKTRLVP
ncbi:polysaccharide deacetylase family protein [Lederbergia citrea]|uniref:Polysaccharide deacetylase family protein n=1 Tax=Lederbergia citrea TaxID=2833581 RepID=A0A942UYC4_9BACI|nr:polysaccharide deacetylase family protein [Lederbergia citrea]MBS4179612.1 polysaccharide deacetylase family protein [Lederbergia citrea]MBS4225009.1 polysaccharide deacetylase family protein [Lederbergia citrea]